MTGLVRCPGVGGAGCESDPPALVRDGSVCHHCHRQLKPGRAVADAWRREVGRVELVPTEETGTD